MFVDDCFKAVCHQSQECRVPHGIYFPSKFVHGQHRYIKKHVNTEEDDDRMNSSFRCENQFKSQRHRYTSTSRYTQEHRDIGRKIIKSKSWPAQKLDNFIKFTNFIRP